MNTPLKPRAFFQCKLLWESFATLLIFLWITNVSNANGQMIIFQEDFESGLGNWFADNGVWEVGIPVTNPPAGAHSGQNCAGTDLKSNYPANSRTSFQSPVGGITLPNLSTGEVLQLRFWHWFNIFGGDSSYVRISANGGAWKTISHNFDWNSNAWSHFIIDISSYAGSTIRLAFYFWSSSSAEAKGWFIDDISIVKGVFKMSDSVDFELGIGDWYADNGVWEVGMPISIPIAHSGSKCAATVLGGNYPARANSRLISPEITLTQQSAEIPQLTFYQWFNIFSGDSAVVQISVEGGPWQTISPNFGPNSDWSAFARELSAYINDTVRFAFYFSSNTSSEARGWYIDDVVVKGIISTGIDEKGTQAPASFYLNQNYPNPFNPKTVILYELPQTSLVEVAIFNLLGERIHTLVNQRQAAGQHRLHWDGRNEFGMLVPSGVYLYRLRAGEFVQTRKMILMQ